MYWIGFVIMFFTGWFAGYITAMIINSNKNKAEAKHLIQSGTQKPAQKTEAALSKV